MTAPVLDRISATHVNFSETCWPRRLGDSVEVNEIHDRLQYGTTTRTDLLFAAEVLRAYSALLRTNGKGRETVARALVSACVTVAP